MYLDVVLAIAIVVFVVVLSIIQEKHHVSLCNKDADLCEQESIICSLRKALEAQSEERCKANSALAKANMLANCGIEKKETLERNVKKGVAMVSDLTKEIENRKGACRTLEAHVDNLHKQTSCLYKMVENNTKHATAIGKEIAALELSNTSFTALNTALKTENACLTKLTSFLQTNLTVLSQQAREHTTTLAKKDASLASKEQELYDLTMQIRHKADELQSLTSSKAETATLLSDQTDYIDWLQTNLLEQRDATTSWQTNATATIKALTGSLAALRNDLKTLQAHSAHTIAELEGANKALVWHAQAFVHAYGQCSEQKGQLEMENERLEEELRGAVGALERREEGECEGEGEDKGEVEGEGEGEGDVVSENGWWGEDGEFDSEAGLGWYDDVESIVGVDPLELSVEGNDSVVGDMD